MACPSFASGSSISLWYTIDPDPAAALPGTLNWEQIRMTGESLDLKITAEVSTEITPTRSDADSTPVKGEAGGSFEYEASHGFLSNWLIAALQANKDFTFVGQSAPSSPWNSGAITNGSTQKCIVIQKRVLKSDGTYDLFIFRGCQVDQLSIKFAEAAKVTGSVAVMGVGGEVQSDLASLPVGWTYTAAPSDPIMSSMSSLEGLELQNSGGTDTETTFSAFDLMISNKARTQSAVGRGIYPVGIGFGPIEVKMSTTAYYADTTVFSALLNNAEMKVEFTLEDSDNNVYAFLLDKVKVQSGATPLATGKDNDATIATALQAFQSDSNGTIKITKS